MEHLRSESLCLVLGPMRSDEAVLCSLMDSGHRARSSPRDRQEVVSKINSMPVHVD
jgi:hypothetical protein